MNGKWGYIDRTGAYIIKPQFDEIKYSVNSGAEALNWRRYGIINTRGEVVVPAVYHDIHYFYNDEKSNAATASVRLHDKWGCIDRTGKVVTPITSPKKLLCGYESDSDKQSEPYKSVKTADYEAVWPASEGMRRVFKDGKYGFINKDGDLVVPAVYNRADDFYGSFTVAEKWTGKKEQYLVSKNGRVLRPPVQFNTDGTEKEILNIDNTGNGHFIISYDEKETGYPHAIQWLVAADTGNDSNVARYVGNTGYIALENLSEQYGLLRYSLPGKSYRFRKNGEVTQVYPPIKHKPVNLPEIKGANYVYE